MVASTLVTALLTGTLATEDAAALAVSRGDLGDGCETPTRGEAEGDREFTLLSPALSLVPIRGPAEIADLPPFPRGVRALKLGDGDLSPNRLLPSSTERPRMQEVADTTASRVTAAWVTGSLATAASAARAMPRGEEGDTHDIDLDADAVVDENEGVLMAM